MKKFQLGFLMVVAVLGASCASIPDFREEKTCGENPRIVVGMFFEGVRDMNLGLLRNAVAGNSVLQVFRNSDGERGQPVLRELVAHPELARESGSCTCSALSVIDTNDPEVKSVVVKRYVLVGEEMYTYKRAFAVHFTRGNCVVTVEAVNPKWERF